jgi:ABC-type branched-subunit amino acid transport system permease subunit
MVFLVILIASFLLQLVMPWWIIVIISFATCGIIGKTGKVALWHPFFAIVVAWTAMALFKSIPNQHILATRIANMFGLHFWWWTLIISSLLGGFVAAVSGFCGYHFRKAVLAIKSAA